MSRRLAGSALPYSKVCDLDGDAEQLGPFAQIVDRSPNALAGQHGIRRWEYAMALRTITGWAAQQVVESPLDAPPMAPLQICDVGGAGSGFWKVLAGLTTQNALVIDASLPADLSPMGYAQVDCVRSSVEEYAAVSPHRFLDVITCISVIEHVEEVRKFFRACHMLLKPGGLLFLTADYWDAEGPDTAHFHWMRQRIYNAERIQKLLGDLRTVGFRSFGQADWAYPGPQLYDYSIASLAVVKKETV